MPALQNIVLAGATGNLGPSILSALLAANVSVTVLTRESSKHTLPSTVKVVKVDYSSFDSLVAAFRHQDAVVCAVGGPTLEVQARMIDAAIAAKVKRFIPSEFGSDISNPKTKLLPVYKDKVAIEDYLRAKSAEGLISYTNIYTGSFLDWGIMVGLIMNVKGRKAELYNGGEQLFSATRLSTIGAGVVGVIKHPDETKDRAVYIHDTVISLKKLLKISQELTPGETWDVTMVEIEPLVKKALEDWAAGRVHLGTMVPQFKCVMFGDGYGAAFQKTDNALFGIPEISDAEMRKVITACL